MTQPIAVPNISASTTHYKSHPSLSMVFHIHPPFHVFKKVEKLAGYIGPLTILDPCERRWMTLLPTQIQCTACQLGNAHWSELRLGHRCVPTKFVVDPRLEDSMLLLPWASARWYLVQSRWVRWIHLPRIVHSTIPGNVHISHKAAHMAQSWLDEHSSKELTVDCSGFSDCRYRRNVCSMWLPLVLVMS